jgi:hypothetical protein
MSNEKFRDLKIGDIVWVYNHATESINKALVNSITGSGFEETFPIKSALQRILDQDAIRLSKHTGCNVGFAILYNEKELTPIGKKFGLEDKDIQHIEYISKLMKGSFYVKYDEEKSRRGEDYTGFLTREDAIEFKEILIKKQINNLKSRMNELEFKIEELKKSES